MSDEEKTVTLRFQATGEVTWCGSVQVPLKVWQDKTDEELWGDEAERIVRANIDFENHWADCDEDEIEIWDIRLVEEKP